jgi:hypothetical protein
MLRMYSNKWKSDDGKWVPKIVAQVVKSEIIIYVAWRRIAQHLENDIDQVKTERHVTGVWSWHKRHWRNPPAEVDHKLQLEIRICGTRIKERK